MSGADGLMVEVHPNPDVAMSDAKQQLNLDQFNELMDEIESISLGIQATGDLIWTVRKLLGFSILWPRSAGFFIAASRHRRSSHSRR